MVNFVLRHSGLEREGGISKDILTFPLSFCPTAADISLSLEAGRAQLGQVERAEPALDDYILNAGLGAWTCLVTWVCFISSRVRWASPTPQLRSISSRVDRFDRDFPQKYLVHRDLQPVTFEQAHLVDFESADQQRVRFLRGQCGHKRRRCSSSSSISTNFMVHGGQSCAESEVSPRPFLWTVTTSAPPGIARSDVVEYSYRRILLLMLSCQAR